MKGDLHDSSFFFYFLKYHGTVVRVADMAGLY
jgi:hypothetical protein